MSKWLVLICRLVVGGVFVYASLDKLAHPAAFAESIHHYRMVPYALLHAFALLLPVVEMITGAALILGLFRRGAALLAGLMLLVFMIAISTALARGLDISCGCFNTDGGHVVGLGLLWRDAAWFLLCLPILFLKSDGPGIDALLRK